MISANASASLDWIFERAVCETSVLGPEDRCSVNKNAGRREQRDDSPRQLVVLNISSYVFRIVALFEFDINTQTRTHLARIARNNATQLSDQAFLDACAEFVNMICGAANRKLGESCLVGMSTPFFLESTCAQYLSMLNPVREQSFEVVINDSVLFHFTLCICVANDAEVDFTVDRTIQEDVSQGALELF